MAPMNPDLVVLDDGLARPVWASREELMRAYYDTEWGMPVRDERGMFERLSLEAFQSGLSWATILRKRPAFRRAFADFDPDAVAAFDDDDVARLLGDAGIVRNRAKVSATIINAQATVRLRGRVELDGDVAAVADRWGDGRRGLVDLVWSHRPPTTPAPERLADIPVRSPESAALAKELKRRGFAFVGPTTMYALMEAIGVVDTHLLGSHRRGTSGVWRPPPGRGGDNSLCAGVSGSPQGEVATTFVYRGVVS